MNAPFQSVGIIFFVTIVHVVVIAVYSSRTLPETTFQRSIVLPDVDSLEVMPEQLVRDLSVSRDGDEPESCLDYLKEGVVLDSDSDTGNANPGEKTVEEVKSDVPKPAQREPEKAASVEVPPGKVAATEESPVVSTEVPSVIKAERWEESDFAKRVSYPHLDGILGKKSGKLAENKPSPAPKSEARSPGPASEPAPRSRTFSPIPRS